MRWFLQVAPLLVVFWVVLSGHFEVLFLALGAVSVGLVFWLTWRANVVWRERAALHVTLRLPLYLIWLVKEVLVSSASVVRKVWTPRLDLRPVVDVTPSEDMSVLSQVVYANSITFTPGTLSLDLEEEQILVHSLDAAGIEALHGGRMARRVRRLEGRR